MTLTLDNSKIFLFEVEIYLGSILIDTAPSVSGWIVWSLAKCAKVYIFFHLSQPLLSFSWSKTCPPKPRFRKTNSTFRWDQYLRISWQVAVEHDNLPPLVEYSKFRSFWHTMDPNKDMAMSPPPQSKVRIIVKKGWSSNKDNHCSRLCPTILNSHPECPRPIFGPILDFEMRAFLSVLVKRTLRTSKENEIGCCLKGKSEFILWICKIFDDQLYFSNY